MIIITIITTIIIIIIITTIIIIIVIITFRQVQHYHIIKFPAEETELVSHLVAFTREA